VRSMNVKKIAALAAGAALVAAGVAAAGAITYSNTPIISASGVPQVKVVVGQNAAASDGVVAANIAAMVGNLAWRSQAVTASVSGTSGVGCTVTGGGGGAGTCSISNEKVWLNVTLPGVVSGAVEFRTLINDWVDKKLENRNESSDDDKYFQSNDASPLEFSQAVKKFTASDFPALATGSITDTYANVGYTEEQTLWVRAKTKYDDALKKIIGYEPDLAYQIKFTHDQYGIPVAVCNPIDGAIFPDYSNVTLNRTSPAIYQWRVTDETDRACATTDRTDRHRVQVKFLGEDYIISEMNPPVPNETGTAMTCVLAGTGDDSNGSCQGGSIKLAKESAYGIIHVGENLSTGSYYVKLADITTPAHLGFVTYASIEIYDMNNNLLKEDQIEEGQPYTWTAPDGSKIRIRNYKNNPGYYAYAKWAEMAIYSKEFELRNNEAISDDCTNWKVFLTWKNKDPSKGSLFPDSLKTILLRNEGNNADKKMVEGDTQNIICSPVVWQLQYNGLTCADPGDYDALGLSIISRTFTYQQTPGVSGCGTKVRLPDGNVLRVTSGLAQPFNLDGAETDQVSTFYVNLGTNLLNVTYGGVVGTTGNNVTYLNLTPAGNWGSQTTFTAVGIAPDGTLTLSSPNTTGTTSGDLLLFPSTGGVAKNFANLTALTATGATYGTVFNLGDAGSTTLTGQGALAIGNYSDAGEVIWTSSGTSDCDVRMEPSSVRYDMGDGTLQPIVFGTAAVSGTGWPNSGVWCNVEQPANGGTCQVDIDGYDGMNERAFAWREDAGNSPPNYDFVRVYIMQRAQAGSPYQFVDPMAGGVMDTTPDKMNYTGVGIGPAPQEGPQTVGFITDRGTKFTSISTTSAAFKVAKKVCEAQYFMKTSGTAPNEPIQVGPLGEGESTVGLAGGIVIKVTQITEDVGTCTAVAGGAQCTVTGLDQLTAAPSVTSTVIPTDLDTATNKLVVLDSNADRGATLIVVGGNTVNTIADEIIRSSNIDLRTDTVVVRAIGTNRILVAGYSAQDTVTAGDQFIQALIAAKTA